MDTKLYHRVMDLRRQFLARSGLLSETGLIPRSAVLAAMGAAADRGAGEGGGSGGPACAVGLQPAKASSTAAAGRH
jgi:hypothetical protein